MSQRCHARLANIPTSDKIAYLNQLLQVGFDVLDCGSFVSPKAIPQMADTKAVIKGLDLSNCSTKLLTIVANTRGAEDAVQYDEVSYLGFPFSISETFQMRNTNKTIAASLTEVEHIQNLCSRANKDLVIYISMGFGNPYGDPYNADIAIQWVEQLSNLGIKTFAMSDTVGVADVPTIQYIFSHLIPAFPHLEIGAHLHTSPFNWVEKLEAAWQAGCRRYDMAILGIGGCPMAKDDLVGNLATENLLQWSQTNNIALPINQEAYQKAHAMAQQLFQKH
jgi:hydroxymethylglutaryl-CoA lyase